MIPAKISGKEYTIPTSWNDVPFNKWVKFVPCDNVLSQIEALTDIPKDDLLALNSEGLGAILGVLEFMNEAPDSFLAEDKKIDIGRDTYGKVETAKAILMQHEFTYQALPKIVQIYTGEDYSDRPTSEAYPLGAFFLLNYLHFLISTKG